MKKLIFLWMCLIVLFMLYSLDKPEKIEVTESERALLERVVLAEARGEDERGQIAIVNVIFNRVNSSKWPNTIEEVLVQKDQFFLDIGAADVDFETAMKARKSVEKVLNGKRVIPKKVDCFAYYQIDFNNWAIFYEKIGNHNFWVSNKAP